MVGMARFFLEFTTRESCGKCVHCRLGTRRMLDVLIRITEGEGQPGDIELLEELCAALRRLQVRHFVPESLHAAAPQGIVLLPAAVSGGSFGEMLDALCTRYGAENLCLDLVRSRSDFSMPSYDPSGTPLSREELEQLRETHRAESFYSPQLCCRYFTYLNRSGAAHFVLLDDGDTARNKLAEIRKRGIPWVILLYSEWGPEARELLAGEAASCR